MDSQSVGFQESKEEVLIYRVSDEALEAASGSNSEGVPTLAFGSYCFTCTKVIA